MWLWFFQIFFHLRRRKLWLFTDPYAIYNIIKNNVKNNLHMRTSIDHSLINMNRFEVDTKTKLQLSSYLLRWCKFRCSLWISRLAGNIQFCNSSTLNLKFTVIIIINQCTLSLEYHLPSISINLMKLKIIPDVTYCSCLISSYVRLDGDRNSLLKMNKALLDWTNASGKKTKQEH